MLIFLQWLTECVLLFSSSYNFAPVPTKDRPRFLSKMERTSALAQPIFFQDSLFPFSRGRLPQLSCSAQIFCSVWGGGGVGGWGVNYTERWRGARQPLRCTVPYTHSLLPAVLQLQGSPVGLGARPSWGLAEMTESARNESQLLFQPPK